MGLILLLLTWGSLPYLPAQIDDSYIVFAYAHNVVEQHAIVWNTGERVEGYSSPLHLALMTLGVLAGLDLALFARVLAFACAVAVVVRLQRPSVGEHRFLLALLFTAWQPFEFWATSGMETALATLIGVVAWPLVMGRREEWARGVAWLALYSVTRPEGLGWLAIALTRRLFLGKEVGGPERLVAGSLAALAAYHAARVGYFGYLLPTPYVVKVAAVGEYGPGIWQAAREVASTSALLAATALFRRSVSPWAWAPFVVQVALLVRAGGDWMGHARFLVPGLAASVAAAWTSGVPRRPGWLAWGMVGVLGVVGFVVEPTRVPAAGAAATVATGVREVGRLLHPLTSARTPWAVPLIEETSFLVTRLPAGAGAELSDVGLPGNLPDAPIWDASGLTDRVVATAFLAHSRAIPPEIMERYRSARIWCVRYLQGAGGEETADGLLLELYPEVTPSRIGVPDLVWRCREGGEPGVELVAERWERLLDRYPSQDWIRWYYVRSLIELGRLGDARAAADDATWMAGHGLAWTLFGGIPFNRYRPGRGWAKYENGAISSMAVGGELWQGIVVGLDVDDPGPDGAAVRMRWEPECGSPLEVIIRGRTEIEPPVCASSDPRALVVDFLNDAYGPGVDRNIYVEALGR